MQIKRLNPNNNPFEAFMFYFDNYTFLSNYDHRQRHTVEKARELLHMEGHLFICDYAVDWKNNYIENTISVWADDYFIENTPKPLCVMYSDLMREYRRQLMSEGITQEEIDEHNLDLYIGCETEYWPEKYPKENKKWI